MRRLPVVRLYIAVALAQGGLLLALNHSRVTTPAVALQLLLLWRLYRGSSLCWGLLLVENGWEAFAALAILLGSFQGDVLWANAAALVVPAAAQIWLLLTRPMRAHVSQAGALRVAAP
jgi:hypothetical protein